MPKASCVSCHSATHLVLPRNLGVLVHVQREQVEPALRPSHRLEQWLEHTARLAPAGGQPRSLTLPLHTEVARTPPIPVVHPHRSHTPTTSCSLPYCQTSPRPNLLGVKVNEHGLAVARIANTGGELLLSARSRRLTHLRGRVQEVITAHRGGVQCPPERCECAGRRAEEGHVLYCARRRCRSQQRQNERLHRLRKREMPSENGGCPRAWVRCVSLGGQNSYSDGFELQHCCISSPAPCRKQVSRRGGRGVADGR